MAKIPKELRWPRAIRSFIPSTNDFYRLRDFVLAAYRELDRKLADDPQSVDPEVRTSAEWGGYGVRHLKALYPQTGKALAPIISAIESRWPGAKFLEDVSVFRRILPDKSTYIYWHNDADGTGSHQFDPAWNCWIPMEDVGVDYPSLEIIADSEAFMRSIPPLHPGHRDDAWVAEQFPNPKIFCPNLKRGDALIFSHYHLHRTQPMMRLKGSRIGAEMRFTIPGATQHVSWINRVRGSFGI